MMHPRIGRIIYSAGCCVRGAPVLNFAEQLKNSQWWSIGQHRENQLLRAKELLSHAWEHSLFYRKYLQEHGFDPGIGSLDDLKSLPPIEKGVLLNNVPDIQNEGRGGRLIYSKTSGSSGIPLAFYRESDWDAQHRAAILRGCSWYGVDPWMPSGLLWGIPSGSYERLKARLGDFLQNRFRQKRFELSIEVLEAFYSKMKKAEYLYGYSSMIYELAKYINDNHPGDSGLSLKLVKGTSEKIYPNYQEESRRAFGLKITSEYGAAETGIIAFECPEGSLHVNMEHSIVDVEKDEIVVTNLLSFSFPFIRYKLGDYVRLKDEGFACPCGREGMVIEEIIGRVGESIYGKAGRIYPSMTVDYIIKFLPKLSDRIAQCQAVQSEKGRLDFFLVMRRDFTNDDKGDFESSFGALFRSYYGDSMDYAIRYVGSIPRRGGKQIEFVSEIGD